MQDRVFVYCFDIDGTICTDTAGAYETAEPFPERILRINELFHSGHVIKMFTARGSTTGIDWSNLTKEQLNSWGVKYHELILGKPHADLFIDNKATHSDLFLWTSPDE